MASVPVLKISPSQKQRYGEIKSRFNKLYGRDPEFYARASGRVNLIGEHIDYCGYAVLPMAIEQDVVIAVAANSSGKLNLNNLNSRYEPFSCSTTDVQIDKANPQWYHYFLCGYKGILEQESVGSPRGMDLFVDGIVPQGAGLSSSSALVCCAAVATMHANGKQYSKLVLAELSQRCERYIGLEGGGMDQAISFLAEPGTAKLIEFNPVRAEDVTLPDGANFVISNSCVESNKVATSHYNIRVAECRLAAQVMAKAKGLDWRAVRRLDTLQQSLGVTLAGMAQVVTDSLHTEPYGKQEICDLLGVTADELNQISLSEKTVNEATFRLRDRALHVYTEADRVRQFQATCSTSGDHQRTLSQLGDLMTASHVSCRDLYQCSCPELDQLTEIASRVGALGSRLTGAGWGGCAVSLVPSDKVTSFLEQLRAEYYAGDARRLAEVDKALFATQPGGGACIYTE